MPCRSLPAPRKGPQPCRTPATLRRAPQPRREGDPSHAKKGAPAAPQAAEQAAESAVPPEVPKLFSQRLIYCPWTCFTGPAPTLSSSCQLSSHCDSHRPLRISFQKSAFGTWSRDLDVAGT